MYSRKVYHGKGRKARDYLFVEEEGGEKMEHKEFAYVCALGEQINRKLDRVLSLLEVGKDTENRSDNTAKSDCKIPDKSNG